MKVDYLHSNDVFELNAVGFVKPKEERTENTNQESDHKQSSGQFHKKPTVMLVDSMDRSDSKGGYVLLFAPKILQN